MSTADRTPEEERVQEFLRQRKLSRHHDPVDITGIQMEVGTPMAWLKVADLQFLLDELDRTRRLFHSLTQGIE